MKKNTKSISKKHHSHKFLAGKRRRTRRVFGKTCQKNEAQKNKSHKRRRHRNNAKRLRENRSLRHHFAPENDDHANREGAQEQTVKFILDFDRGGRHLKEQNVAIASPIDSFLSKIHQVKITCVLRPICSGNTCMISCRRRQLFSVDESGWKGGSNSIKSAMSDSSTASLYVNPGFIWERAGKD